MVTPTTATLLEQQLKGRPVRLPEEERAAYAREAASLLAQVASEPGSPYAADLTRVRAALASALNVPTTSLAASVALADVPDVNAQRGLAAAALDPARPAQLRQRRGHAARAQHSALRSARLGRSGGPASRSLRARVGPCAADLPWRRSSAPCDRGPRSRAAASNGCLARGPAGNPEVEPGRLPPACQQRRPAHAGPTRSGDDLPLRTEQLPQGGRTS